MDASIYKEGAVSPVRSCPCCGKFRVFDEAKIKKYGTALSTWVPALFYGYICKTCESETKRTPVRPYPATASLRKYERDLASGKEPCPFTIAVNLVDGSKIDAPVKLTPTGKLSKDAKVLLGIAA